MPDVSLSPKQFTFRFSFSGFFKFKKENSRKSVEIRKQSVAIKRTNRKGKCFEGKNHPLFQMCEGFYYSEHSFHLAQLLEKGERQKKEAARKFPPIFRVHLLWHMRRAIDSPPHFLFH